MTYVKPHTRITKGKRIRVSGYYRRKKRSNSGFWIQSAVKKPGSLRKYMRRRFGSQAFTERGTIKVSYLHKAINDPRTTMTTKRRARLALTLRKM